MKNILMIAYHFHPDREVGALRTVKFAKYLPGFGWKPIILTVKQKYYEKPDKTALDFDCSIFRTSKIPLIKDIYIFLKPLVKSILRRKTEEQVPHEIEGSGTDSYQYLDVPLWKRFINSFSWTPDDQIGWLVPAVIKAVRTIRKYEIDVIYSSGPPHTCHLVGLFAALFTGKFWVADFRDPWTQVEKPFQVVTKLSRNLEKYMERKVISRANLVISTSEEFKKLLADTYPLIPENKFHVITNGFDEDEFPKRNKMSDEKSGPITFMHAGTLYVGRDPSSVIRAIGELIKEGFLDRNDIKMELMGRIEIDSKSLSEKIEQYETGDIVFFKPTVGRAEYLNIIMKTDVLLLIQTSMASNQIPAKTFDYIATGNQILALVPPGATRNLLAEFPNVEIADPNDISSVKRSVETLITRLRSGRGKDFLNEKKMNVLSRRYLTGRFSKLLDGLESGN